jgi:hypothetical protein
MFKLSSSSACAMRGLFTKSASAWGRPMGLTRSIIFSHKRQSQVPGRGSLSRGGAFSTLAGAKDSQQSTPNAGGRWDRLQVAVAGVVSSTPADAVAGVVSSTPSDAVAATDLLTPGLAVVGTVVGAYLGMRSYNAEHDPKTKRLLAEEQAETNLKAAIERLGKEVLESLLEEDEKFIPRGDIKIRMDRFRDFWLHVKHGTYIVVTGPKGLGKTTGVVEIVRGWEDGVGAVLVRIDSVDTSRDAMAGKVLKKLGLPESGGIEALVKFCKTYKAVKGKPAVILLSANTSNVEPTDVKKFAKDLRDLQKEIALYCLTIADISSVNVGMGMGGDPRAKIITMSEMTAKELLNVLPNLTFGRDSKPVERAVAQIGGNSAEWLAAMNEVKDEANLDDEVKILLDTATTRITVMAKDDKHKQALKELAEAEYDEGVKWSVFEKTGGFKDVDDMRELSEKRKVFYNDVPTNTVRFYGKALYTAARNELVPKKK